MHTVVVGAGLTGLSTAFYLTEAGMEVTIVDALPGPIQAASYSCSAQLNASAPSLSAPATDCIGRLRARCASTSGLLYKSTTALKYAEFVSHLTLARKPQHAERIAQNMRLMSQTSASLTRAIAASHHIHLQESLGTLFLDGNDSGEQPDTRDLRSLLRTPVINADPSKITYDAKASTFNVSFYAKQIKELLSGRHVRMLFSHQVTGLLKDGQRVAGVLTPHGRIEADAVILAAGASAQALLPNTISQASILAPVTRAVMNVEYAPDIVPFQAALLFDKDNVIIAPLEHRLRVQGHWFLGIPSKKIIESEQTRLWNFCNNTIPQAALWHSARYFHQTVLATPDGLPIIGSTPIDDLFLNIGGGLHGADFASFAAKLTVEALTKEPPNALLPALAFDRF